MHTMLLRRARHLVVASEISWSASGQLPRLEASTSVTKETALLESRFGYEFAGWRNVTGVALSLTDSGFAEWADMRPERVNPRKSEDGEGNETF
ncbi:hypothetical protein IWX91DRAFT_340099 [Phyllosticta citricarpa]